MDHNIAIVDDQPAIVWMTLKMTPYFVLFPGFIHYCICKSFKHAVAAGGTQYKIISKISNIVNIDQYDVFPLLILKGVYNSMCD